MFYMQQRNINAILRNYSFCKQKRISHHIYTFFSKMKQKESAETNPRVILNCDKIFTGL